MLVAQTSNFFPAIYTMEQYVIDYSPSQPLPYFHKMEGPGPIPMCENEGQDTEASERKEFILKHPEVRIQICFACEQPQTRLACPPSTHPNPVILCLCLR